MSRGRFIVVLILGFAVVSSAVGVVYAKYASRKHFVELQTIEKQRDAMDVQWGRLQLEQSTWGTHGRVATVAKRDLKMRIPKAEEVLVIRP